MSEIIDLSFDRIRESVKAKDFMFFEKGEYNLNLVGIRTKDNSSNKFNDHFVVCFSDGSNWISQAFPITTDPGLFYRKNPMNVNGTLILVPAQHRSLFKRGKHKGRYKALVQNAPCRVYRDDNKDSKLDFDESSIESGLFGLNCHDSNKTGHSKQVDKWSAGCQVFANHYDHLILMALVDRAAYRWGDGFTYTLLKEDWLV